MAPGLSMKSIRRIIKDDLDKIGKKKKVSIEE